LDKIEPGDSAAVEDLPVVGSDLLQLKHLHIIQYSTAIDLFFWENVRGSLEYRCKKRFQDTLLNKLFYILSRCLQIWLKSIKILQNLDISIQKNYVVFEIDEKNTKKLPVKSAEIWSLPSSLLLIC